jgi:hypothetical protein
MPDVREVNLEQPCEALDNAVIIKAGLPFNGEATFKLAGTEAKGLKCQNKWPEKRGVECGEAGSCDAIALVGGGKDVPLQIAARIQRMVSLRAK